MRKNIFRQFGYLVGICLFVLALFVMHYKLKQYNFSDIAAQLRQTPFFYLLLAGGLTILDYFVLTLYDTMALSYIGRPLGYPRIALASFVGYVFGHNLTIVGGSTAKYRIYSALGISASEIARLIAFCSFTFWLGFFSLAGATFAFLPHQIPVALHIPFSSVRPLGFVFLAVVVGYIVVAVLRKKPVEIRGWKFAYPGPLIVLGQLLISCTDWLLACGVLYALLPGGITLSFPHFISLFLLAQIAGLSSSVPGGLGVFEGAILLMLSPFAPSSAIFGSLLLYRLIYYLLPFGLAAGTLAIHELVISRKVLKAAGIVFEKWASAVMPQILALTSFAAGIILLFSGSLPAAEGRMALLRDILPLPAIEFSHFLASLAGALLLLFARSIQRRINIAYYMTVFLLVFGVVFSLLKGFDYEEAIILSLILLAFLPCYKEFYRKSAIFSRRFELYWVALIAAVILCSVWIGFFSYRHIEYSNQLWWRFAIHGDAPRFLRATLGVVIVILWYAAAKLLLPFKPRKQMLLAEIEQDAKRIINDSPRTGANLALLGDKQFLLNDEKNAFIMYSVSGKSWIALSDPVGPQEEWDELLWKFKELCDYYDGWPVFYQIENTHLDLYLDLGMNFIKLGEEARLKLNDFSLDGAENKNLRYSHNRIQKLGYEFEIIQPGQLGPILEKLEAISDSWLKEKKTREKRFSLGSFSREYISNFPVAIVRRGNEIMAFANILRTGRKEELSADLMRHSADCTGGIMDYLFAEIILWGKEQGYEWFNLGMAPLSGLTDNALSPLWHKFGTLVFRHGEYFYNFKGLRQYKQKFNPIWQSRYIACPKGLMLPRILTNLASLISGGITGTVAR
jgi:phosphatidylglycerol lysyltransferase